MVMIKDYMREAVDCSKSGFGKEELARRLGADVKTVEMCEDSVREDLKEIIIIERNNVKRAAEILGFEAELLREYAYIYHVPITPGREFRPKRILEKAEVYCVNKPEYIQKTTKAEERRRKSEAERKRMQEIKSKIKKCLKKGVKTITDIARETGLSRTQVRYNTRGNPHVVGKTVANLLRIGASIRKGAEYVDEVSEISGLGNGVIRNLNEKYKLKLKGRRPYHDYVSYVTNEEERHRRKPETIRRDQLIGAGYKLREIAEIEGRCREAIRQYINSTGQYKKWRDARMCRDIIEDGGLIGVLRLED